MGHKRQKDVEDLAEERKGEGCVGPRARVAPCPGNPIPHRLSLRLFLRCGLDWARCGEDTSFFRSLVGEGGPVPLPI